MLIGAQLKQKNTSRLMAVQIGPLHNPLVFPYGLCQLAFVYFKGDLHFDTSLWRSKADKKVYWSNEPIIKFKFLSQKRLAVHQLPHSFN